jgi:hypothetical protein
MVVIGNSGIDCIFWSLGNQLVLQLRVLQHRTRKLNMKMATVMDIGELIELHEKLFGHLKELNDLFKLIMFFQLILGAFAICVIGFQIVVVCVLNFN